MPRGNPQAYGSSPFATSQPSPFREQHPDDQVKPNSGVMFHGMDMTEPVYGAGRKKADVLSGLKRKKQSAPKKSGKTAPLI